MQVFLIISVHSFVICWEMNSHIMLNDRKLSGNFIDTRQMSNVNTDVNNKCFFKIINSKKMEQNHLGQ